MALNLSFNSIPVGSYVGTISDIRFHHGEIVSVIPSCSITHEGQTHTLSGFFPLDAPTGHPRYFETAKGKGLVANLLGAALHIADLDDLAGKLLGLKVRVLVGSRNHDGFLVPKIISISREEPLMQKTQED